MAGTDCALCSCHLRGASNRATLVIPLRSEEASKCTELHPMQVLTAGSMNIFHYGQLSSSSEKEKEKRGVSSQLVRGTRVSRVPRSHRQSTT